MKLLSTLSIVALLSAFVCISFFIGSHSLIEPTKFFDHMSHKNPEMKPVNVSIGSMILSVVSLTAASSVGIIGIMIGQAKVSYRFFLTYVIRYHRSSLAASAVVPINLIALTVIITFPLTRFAYLGILLSLFSILLAIFSILLRVFSTNSASDLWRIVAQGIACKYNNRMSDLQVEYKQIIIDLSVSDAVSLTECLLQAESLSNRPEVKLRLLSTLVDLEGASDG